MSTSMDATQILLSAVLGLVYTAALLGTAYMLTSVRLRAAADLILSQVRQAVPEAETLFKQLKSESGRARNLLKKAGNTAPDDDDLLHALQHPLAQGILRGAGIDAARVQAGDPDELAKLQALGRGKQANNAERMTI